jgi:hypothetical protein
MTMVPPRPRPPHGGVICRLVTSRKSRCEQMLRRSRLVMSVGRVNRYSLCLFERLVAIVAGSDLPGTFTKGWWIKEPGTPMPGERPHHRVRWMPVGADVGESTVIAGPGTLEPECR